MGTDLVFEMLIDCYDDTKDELECMAVMTDKIEFIKDKYENCEEFRNKLNDLLKKFED